MTFLKSVAVEPKEWAELGRHPFDVASIRAMIDSDVPLRFGKG